MKEKDQLLKAAKLSKKEKKALYEAAMAKQKTQTKKN